MATRTQKTKLNLGCGKDIRKDCVNLDFVKLKGVDVVWDFNKRPWPFEKDRFSELISNHVLEHTAYLMDVMREIHRVCRPGARIKIALPYFANPHSYSDPTHKCWFTSRTFDCFAPGHYYTQGAHFTVEKRKIIMFSCAEFMKSRWYSWPFDIVINAIRPLYERFPYLCPAAEVHFLLRVVKRTK